LKSYFITATDTGIGKTTVTAAMALCLKNLGINVGIMKPFATGTQQKAGFKSEDVTILANAARITDPEDLINPYFFPIPASPYAAANKLKAEINIDLVLQKFERLQTMHEIVLVEGIGGILTPLLKNYCIADLIKDMNLETLVVTSSRIGTVNHTMLTLNAAQKHGLNLLGLIINNIDSTGYNVNELKNDITNLSGMEILCTIPHFENPNTNQIADMLKSTDLITQLKLGFKNSKL
jgi:dethiobiotin synthetase